jgi:hypothetical protein
MKAGSVPWIDRCNCTVLRRASRRVSHFYDRTLASSGLRVTQFAMLALLAQLRELSINEMAQRLELDRTTTGKNLRPLEGAGVVEIGPSPASTHAQGEVDGCGSRRTEGGTTVVARSAEAV